MGLLLGNQELFLATHAQCRQPLIDGSEHADTRDKRHEVDPTLVTGTSYKLWVDFLLIKSSCS